MGISTVARRLAAVTLGSVCLLGLAACTTASPGPDPTRVTTTSTPTTDAGAQEGQTVSEACALVQDTIAEASGEFQNLSTGDPAAVVRAMEAAAAKIAEASSLVTNEEVAALLPPLQEMFIELGDALRALSQGDVSKLGDLERLGATLQETSQRFQSLCSP